MDWGIGQGYMGLYATSNKRESAKQELGMLQVLDQQMKSDRAEKEQADLKEQAYQAEVSKFADTLLAPDRAKINQKSKVLSSMIREHVKANGGDMTKFFANGGHKILGDYKSALVNSEESGQYMENKKNMERIVDMQMKGFGHLINQNDMFNLENYQKNGTGKISYTGQLNQIEVPDMKDFDAGVEVKPEAILHHGQNYVKFLGNYKMTYPDAAYPPTDQELKNFVALSHSDLIGQNWQKDIAYKKEAFDQSINTRDFQYKQERDQVGDSQWYQTFAASREDAEVNQRIQMRELDIAEGKAAGGSASGADKEAKELADAQGTFAYDMENMVTSIGYDVKNVSQISDKAFDPYAANFGLPNLPSYMDSAEDYADSGGGGILQNGGSVLNRTVKNALSPGYMPRGSKLLINGQNATKAMRESGLLNVGDDGIINGLDLTQNTDLIDAAGRNIRDWKNAPDSKGFITKNYAEQVADKKFKVKGVVTGFYGRDKSNNEIMVMNRSTGKGSKVVDKKGNKEYEERISKDVKGAGLFVVMESENGDRFYKPLRGNDQVSLFQKWGGANVEAVKKGRTAGAQRANTVQFKNQQSKANVLGAYDEVNKTPELSSRMIQEARMIPGAGTAGTKYSPLVISFYTQQKNHFSQQGVDASMDEIQQQGAFNKIMQYVNNNPKTQREFKDLINTPGKDERAIIDYLVDIEAINNDYATEWKNSLQFIKNRK